MGDKHTDDSGCEIPQWFGVNSDQQQQQLQQRQQFAPSMLVGTDRLIFPINEDQPTAIANTDQQQHQPPPPLNHQHYYLPKPPDPSDAQQHQNCPYQQQQQSIIYQQDGDYRHPQRQQQQQQYYQQDQPCPQPRAGMIDLTSGTSTSGSSGIISNTTGVPLLPGTSSEPTYNLFLDEIDSYSQSSVVGENNNNTGNTRKRSSNADSRSAVGEGDVWSLSSSGNRSSDNNNNRTMVGTNIGITSSSARVKARSERKRTREKQRRDGVNRQFAELTKILKRLELEERQEMERKARIAAGEVAGAGGAGGSKLSHQSMRLPFIGPNNSVDLVVCAIVRLQHLHNLSKRQQDEVNKLKEELNETKKAGEDTASKLKGVLFNYPIPQPPNLALASVSTVANTHTAPSSSSSFLGYNSTSNTGTVNTNNMNMTGTSTPTMNINNTMEFFQNKQQQQQQQVMMMVPVIMNLDGTATLLGQDVAPVPNMMMPQLGPTSSFVTPSTANPPQSAAINDASSGTNTISQPLQQHQQQQPLHQVNLQQPSPSQQQQAPLRQENNAPITTATVPPGPFFIQQMQQQIAMQMQPRYLQHLQQSQGQGQTIALGPQGGLELIAPVPSQTSTSPQQRTLIQSTPTPQAQQQPLGGGLQQEQIRIEQASTDQESSSSQ